MLAAEPVYITFIIIVKYLDNPLLLTWSSNDNYSFNSDWNMKKQYMLTAATSPMGKGNVQKNVAPLNIHRCILCVCNILIQVYACVV